MRTIQGNPWKGVIPYTINDPHPFNGRNEDIENFFEVIETNDISTLYGRSGIGKTSLLNAGLFPLLKEQGYYPISIRLGVECSKDDSFAQFIVSKLQDIAQCQNNEMWLLPEGAETELDYLWCYFAYHRFFVNGQEVIPIIILDQFEEILRNSREKASLLIRQLSATLHDGTLLDGSDYTIGFRFIISIREDDLYLLEDCIDDSQIEVLKRGRYRLRPIESQKVKEEIIFADRDYFDATAEEQEEIARLIIDCATKDKQVSTLLLSLLCGMVFEKCQPNKISLDKVKLIVDSNPLLSFYREAIKNLPDNMISWIEEKVVDNDRRRIVPIYEIPEEYRPYVKHLYNEENDHRIFAKSSNKDVEEGAIELLHDQLAVAVAENKQIREKERIKKHIKRGFGLLLVLTAIVVSFFVLRAILNRPKLFNPAEIGVGDTIKASPTGYRTKNGKLVLSHCVVDSYSFYGNEDIRCVEIDSVVFGENSLYLPNADTLVIGENFFFSKGLGIPCVIDDYLPCISTIVIKKPIFMPRYYFVIMTSRKKNINYIISDSMSENVKVIDGNLFVKDIYSHFKQPVWVCCAKQEENVFIFGDDISPGKAITIVGAKIKQMYDIANPSKYQRNKYHIINKFCVDRYSNYIVLCCSDSTKSVISSNDIPDSISGDIISIHMPYVKRIENNTFAIDSQWSYNLSVNCPNVEYIGDSAFLNRNVINITLPKVRYIGTHAFYNNNLSEVILDSVRVIKQNAFWSKRAELQKVYLPNIDSIGKKIFYFRNRVGDYRWNPHAFSAEGIDVGHYALMRYYSEDRGAPVYNLERFNISKESIDSGYFHVGDSIFFCKDTIPYLNLDVGNVDYYGRKPIIDKVSLNRPGLLSFVWHNDVYGISYDSLRVRTSKDIFQCENIYRVIRTNRDRYVSDPIAIANNVTVLNCKELPKYKEFVALNIDDIKMYADTNVTLFLPYGMRKIAVYIQKTGMYASVEVMSWTKTLYYKLSYGKVSLMLAARKKWIIRTIIPLNGMIPSMVLLFLAFRARTWKKQGFQLWKKQLLFDILSGTLNQLLFYYCLSEIVWLKYDNLGIISYWRAFFVALAIWVVYLIISGYIRKKKIKTMKR